MSRLTGACLGAIAGSCIVRWMAKHDWPAWWFIMTLLLVAVVLMYFDVKKMDDRDT